MSLGGGNYDTYMAQTVIKNCDVRLYQNQNTSTYFLNKTRIVSFRMERSNEGIVSNAPNDNMVIEIINWNSLGATYKTLMTTRGSYIKVGFVMENVATTYKIVQCVKECKIDKRKNRATLTLCSPFAFMTGNNFIAEVKYNVFAIAGGTEISAENFDSFPLRSLTTFFEGVQLTAMSLGRGVKVPNRTTSEVYPPAHTQTYPPYNLGDYYSLIDLSTTNTTITLDEMNITSVIQESEDDNDRSNIKFYGLQSGTAEQFVSQYAVYSSFPYEVSIDLNQFPQKVITSFLIHGHNGQPIIDISNFYYRVSNNSVFFSLKNASIEPPYQGSGYYFNLIGYDAKELDRSVLDNETEPYVFLTTLLNGGTKIATAQSRTRAYYSHKTFIEFDCRFDPRIEPLDNIYIAGVGTIKVEKISMTFNGAFKGHIRGRLVKNP